MIGVQLRSLGASSRGLTRDRRFTAVIVLTLAIAIGANTAIFSIMNGVLLRTLPYPGYNRILSLKVVSPPQEGRPSGSEGFLDFEKFQAWPRSPRTIEQVAAYGIETVTLGAPGDPERALGAQVSATLFPLLRTNPTRRHAFDAGDRRSGIDRPVILSDRLWRRRFGSNPGIVGKTVSVDGSPFTVLGVMPAEFYFPNPEVELWTLLPFEKAAFASAGTIETRNLPVIVRLRDGASLRQAEAEAQGILKGLSELGTERSPERVRFTPIRDEMVAAVRPAMLALSAAVGLVLLIACINVAGLLLVRSSGRQREAAIRSALGASRSRLVREALAESTLLALLGGLGGLILAAFLNRALPGLLPPDFPRIQDVHLGARVFLFTLWLSGLTGLLCGLLPALRSSGIDPAHSLQGGRGVAPLGLRSQSLLVVTEIALAFVVLVGAGLLLRSFQRLTAVEPGFEPRGVLTATLDFDPIRYVAPGSKESFLGELLSRLAGNAEVKAAGIVSFPPLSEGFALTKLAVVGQPPARTMAVPQLSSAGYLQAMGLRLAAGRWLSEADESGATLVAVVNRTFVHRYMTGDRAVGRQLDIGKSPVDIVGVVEDERLLGLATEAKPEVFTAYARARQGTGQSLKRVTLAIRSTKDPLALVPVLRRLVLDLDPSLPLADVSTMDRRLAASVARPRLYALLIGAFASLGLGLAVAGVYGVLSHFVARQTRAIGIRRALGAPRGAILGMIFGRGCVLIAVGLALGFAASVGTVRFVASLLFGIGTTDRPTYAMAAIVLIAVNSLACAIPARRALSIDTAEALRYER